jgi:hypothetical protein
MSLKITNPYASGTFDSKLFRIPAILTLKNGRVLACSDIRYGNGTDDPANVDTGIRYSDDNGVNWSEPAFVNAFDDMEFCDHNKAIPTSASFVDSAIVQGEDGTVYHMCDACPAYMGLWSAGTYGKENGFIDGKLAVCDKTSAQNAESTKLNKEKYPYYVDDFGADGFAPVKKFSDNEVYDNYYVNRDYKVYKKSGEEYTPVLIKQMNKDGSLSDKDIIANLFYAYSPIKIYPTYYLWVKKSSDNGETWGDGRILNLEIESKGFTGFAPGTGISIDYKGKNRTVNFTVVNRVQLEVYFRIEPMEDGTFSDADINTQKQNIFDYINELDIGTDISITKLWGIVSPDAKFDIVDFGVRRVGGSWQKTNLSIGSREAAVIELNNISIGPEAGM